MSAESGAQRPAGRIPRDWIENVCRRSDLLLWDGYRSALGDEGGAWPRIMFPRKGADRRVGEQEARLAFVAALPYGDEEAPFAVAAEVPTRLSYRFAGPDRGAKAQRASSDLAIFPGGADEPALTVAFKSGGRSGRSEKDETIRQDVAVILAEEPDALWFHVVGGATQATLHGILRTLDEAISHLSNPYRLSGYLARGKAVEPRAKAITFHLCILNPDVTMSIHRTLDYVPGRPQDEFFDIATSAPAAALEIADGQGWVVHRR